MIIGHVYPEHVVPPGALVVEQKYCEVCGRPFVRRFAPTELVERKECYSLYDDVADYVVYRRADHGQRYCGGCRSRALEPDVEAQDKYKAQMPGTENQMRHALHLPKYERPMGRETQAHANTQLVQRRVRRPRAEMMAEVAVWKARIIEAFTTKGQLTTEDMQALIPRCFTPVDAYMRVVGAGFKLRVVGCEKAAPGCKGRGPRIYELCTSTVQ